MKRHIVEVRPVNKTDSECMQKYSRWIAVDNLGFKFGAYTEVQARELAEQYMSPTNTSKEKGVVEWPDRPKPRPRAR